MLLVPASMPAEAQPVPYYGAIVELDKIFYSWTDIVWITVVAPNFNSDSGKIDYIGNTLDSRITIISTNGSKLDFYKLEETAVDNGVFMGAILLSGSIHPHLLNDFAGITSGEGPWWGTLKAKDGDIITVKFSETYSGSTNIYSSPTAMVGWEFASVEWLELDHITPAGQVNHNEVARITVIDRDMNLSPFTRDTLLVFVYSDSQPDWTQLVLTEREIVYKDGTVATIQD